MINNASYCKSESLSKAEQKKLFKEIEVFKKKLIKSRNKSKIENQITELNNKIVCSYIPMVIQVVQKYKHIPAVDLDDLLHEGILGLYYALNKFNHSYNNKFSTYALPWVKLKIHLASKSHYSLNVSPHFLRKFRKYKEIEKKLSKNVRGFITKQYPISYVSFQDLVSSNYDHGTYRLQDIITDKHASIPSNIMEVNDTYKHVEDIIKTLNKDEQYIIRNRYGFDGDKMTLEAIGKKLKLSRERIFAKEREILTRLLYRVKLKP